MDLQVAMLLITVLIGVGIGVAYDIYRGLRRAARSGQAFTAAGDILFWIAATILVFRGLVIGNGGELRSYVFVGAGAGLYIYFQLASAAILWTMIWFWRTILAVFRVIWLAGRTVCGWTAEGAAVAGGAVRSWSLAAGRAVTAAVAGGAGRFRRPRPPGQ
ncbi:MAG TPA: spore cortex biosynthesis protein YabQ [Bacillota bacterium]